LKLGMGAADEKQRPVAAAVNVMEAQRKWHRGCNLLSSSSAAWHVKYVHLSANEGDVSGGGAWAKTLSSHRPGGSYSAALSVSISGGLGVYLPAFRASTPAFHACAATPARRENSLTSG